MEGFSLGWLEGELEGIDDGLLEIDGLSLGIVEGKLEG